MVPAGVYFSVPVPGPPSDCLNQEWREESWLWTEKASALTLPDSLALNTSKAAQQSPPHLASPAPPGCLPQLFSCMSKNLGTTSEFEIEVVRAVSWFGCSQEQTLKQDLSEGW